MHLFFDMSQDFFIRLSDDIQHFLKSKRVAGENFNLFRICGIARNEVYTHSALLCDLLNPKGSHDQGSVFLKLFIETLNLDVVIDGRPVTVTPEYYIGLVKDETGGKLDLLIEIGEQKIAIENKIDAAEQPNWVKRYRSFLGDSGLLIYLTLDGRAPKKIEATQKELVIRISYGQDIIRWLEACKNKVEAAPIIRESLSQYIHLIRYLTRQEKNHLMTKKIVETVTGSREAFEAYCAIRNADNEIRKAIVLELAKRVDSLLPAGLFVVKKPEGNGKSYDGFYFSTFALSEANLNIAISFDEAGYRDCFEGFQLSDEKKPLSANQTELLKKHFSEVLNINGKTLSSPIWPAWRRWSQNGDWDDQVMEQIAFDGASFDHKMKNILENLLKVANLFTDEKKLLKSN